MGAFLAYFLIAVLAIVRIAANVSSDDVASLISNESNESIIFAQQSFLPSNISTWTFRSKPTTSKIDAGGGAVWWVVFLVLYALNFFIVAFPVVIMEQCRKKRKRLEHEVKQRRKQWRRKKVAIRPQPPGVKRVKGKSTVSGSSFDESSTDLAAKNFKTTKSIMGKGKAISGKTTTAETVGKSISAKSDAPTKSISAKVASTTTAKSVSMKPTLVPVKMVAKIRLHV